MLMIRSLTKVIDTFFPYVDLIIAQTVLKWFEQNYTKAGSEKWHLLLSADTAAPININRYNVTNSWEEILPEYYLKYKDDCSSFDMLLKKN